MPGRDPLRRPETCETCGAAMGHGYGQPELQQGQPTIAYMFQPSIMRDDMKIIEDIYKVFQSFFPAPVVFVLSRTALKPRSVMCTPQVIVSRSVKVTCLCKS